jgi:hypothetical protein
VQEYRSPLPPAPGVGADRPDTLTIGEVARLNRGRLPLGVRPTEPTLPVDYRGVAMATVWLDATTDRVIDVVEVRRVVVVARISGGGYPLPIPVESTRTALPASAVIASAAAARDAHATDSRRRLLSGLAVGAGLASAAAAAVAGFGWRAGRRRPKIEAETARVPVGVVS